MDTYLQKLIALRTVDPLGLECQEGLNYLQEHFTRQGLFVERFLIDGVGSLVATTRRGSKTPKVMLGAHLDVVHGTDDQFTLAEKDGKLYGRGVADMKFAIASYMHIADRFKDTLGNYDFGIMISTDEETGGMGVDTLVKRGYLPGVCVLPDGAENWEIEVLAKGLWWCKIDIKGKAAHGSRPWEGDSASMRLVSLLHELQQTFTEQSPAGNTLNIGTMQSGEVVNQVPAHAKADLDIRFLSKEALENIQATVAALCGKYGATQSTGVLGFPAVNDITNPYIAAYAKIVEDVTGHVPKGIVAQGGSDARYFSAAGVPCIVSEPTAGDRHGAHEWIDKKGYEQYRVVISQYLEQFARV